MEALIAEASDPDVDSRSTVRRLVETLSRHDAVEIDVLSPLIRAHVDGDDDLAERTEAQHQAIDLLLSKIEHRSITDPAVGELFAELVAEVRTHFDYEENVVFPALRLAVPPAEWARISEQIDAAHDGASTHPHPHLGRSRVARAAARVIDRGREQTIDR